MTCILINARNATKPLIKHATECRNSADLSCTLSVFWTRDMEYKPKTLYHKKLIMLKTIDNMGTYKTQTKRNYLK